MIYILIFTIVLSVVILLLLYKSLFSVPFLCNLVFIFNAIGTYNYIGIDRLGKPFVLFIVGWITFICGQLFFARKYRRHKFKSEISDNPFAQIRLAKFSAIIFSVGFLFIGLYYFSAGIPMFAKDPDLARFQQQNLPFFGMLFRVIYWVLPMFSVLLISLVKKHHTTKIRLFSVVFCFISLILVIFCGSKGAILEFVLVHLMFFSYNGYRFFTPRRIIVLTLCIAIAIYILLMITARYSGSIDVEKAASIIFVRITTGAAEGFNNIVNYYTKQFGYGFGWFTFVKTFYTLGGTLRLVPKSKFTYDSGNFIALYFRGSNNLAPYTYTILGEGFLDFGIFGLVLYSLCFSWITSFVHFKLKSKMAIYSKNRVFLLAFGWSLVTLASWGYIDGWFVYSFLTLFGAWFLINTFDKITKCGIYQNDFC